VQYASEADLSNLLDFRAAALFQGPEKKKTRTSTIFLYNTTHTPYLSQQLLSHNFSENWSNNLTGEQTQIVG